MSNKIFTNDETKKFDKIYKKLEHDDEFEIMFGGYKKNNSINMKEFSNLLKFLKSYGQHMKYKIEYSNTLDICYNYDKKNFHSYRLTVSEIDKINTYIGLINNRKNNIIFSMLVSKIINKDKNVSIINKIKSFDNSFDIDEFDIRVRLSKEKSVSKKELEELSKLKNDNKLNISFRFKNRISLIIVSNSEVELRVDLTNVKQNSNINHLEKSNNNYELEIDFNKKKKLTAKKERQYSDKILELILLLKKVQQQSNNLLPNSVKSKVLKEYKKLIYNDSDFKTMSSYTMNSQSLEIIHMVEYLPNKYSVTDKADGDRYLGLIFNNKLYFITTNLDVKDSGRVIKDKKYNKSLIDGEYIYIAKYKKHLFASFDILFSKGEDLRNEESLLIRIQALDELLKDCFDYNFKDEMSKEYKLDKMIDNNKLIIKNYVNELNSKLKTSKNDHVISRKYFQFVKGISNSEVFNYAYQLWDIYTKNSKINLPYQLDGIMFTPQNQIYTKNKRDLKYKIYKWKPPNLNSIDFYIKKEHDRDTGKVLNVYDDSDDNNISGKIYQVLNLHVGKVVNNIEIPVLFKKNENLFKAHIFSENGIIRDIEGNVIQDNTVVEFYYNDDSSIPMAFRWVPLRTRYDKTESVVRYNKKYGNNSFISTKIWNSIQQNITIDDIKLLTDEKEYNNQIEKIKKRITAAYISTERQQDVYYQKKTNLAKPMRNFHNYVKSNIIFTYCKKKMYQNEFKKMRVLDIGCGRGGDIQKFYHSRVGGYVGFDPDPNGLYSATDGAFSRYSNFRKKNPDFPKMDFLVADASSLLNLKDQRKTITKTKNSNEILLKKIFGEDSKSVPSKKFDIFNCQLMIHFIFRDIISINNFCENINTYLADEGYILISTLDGDLLNEDFNKNKGVISGNYTDENGEKKVLFKFTREYNNKINDINKPGLGYKSLVKLINDESINEYLVSKEYLIKLFNDKCNLDLIETDLFINMYNQQKFFFENVAIHEEERKTKSYFMKVKEYYNLNDEVNKASLKFTKYHRYYIFKKRISDSVKIKSKKIKKGGSKTVNLASKYLDNNMFEI